MTAKMQKLGIVAGSGSLPRALIHECQKTGRPFCVVALKGHANPDLMPADIPVKWVRLGAVGTGFAEMKKQGATQIVLIGGVRRPSLKELCPDLRGLKFFAKIGLKALGDDGLLRAVIGEIEKEGFKVVGIDDIMPSLLAPSGVLGKYEPTKADETDITRGIDVAKLLGQADVGQAVIVQQGLVLSVEGIEGTAQLISRTASLKREGKGGVLVKVSKPNQERRVDLPTIGPKTVQAIHDAGFCGIAVESGSVLIAEYNKTIELANKLGIFVVGV